MIPAAARSRWPVAVSGAATALAAAGLGITLTSAAAHTTPWLPLAFALALVITAVAVRQPLAGLVCALVSMPIGLHHLFGPLKLQQAITLLAVGGAVLHRLWRGRTPLRLEGPLLWGAALVAVGIVAAASAIDTTVAWRQVLDVAIALVLALLVITVVDGPSRWIVVQRSVLVAGTAVCGPALQSARHLQAHFGGSVVSGRPDGIFGQPNELGAFAMVILLVALGTLLGAERALDRALAAIAAVASTGALLLSLSRGAWIGTVVGLLLLITTVPKARRLLASVASAVVLVAALLGAFAPDSPQVHVVSSRLASLGQSEHNPYDDRPRIWREAIREISTRPLLGEGPANFPVASSTALSQAATVQADHAHDVVLTVAAEAGLLGAGVLVGLTIASALTILSGLRLAGRRGLTHMQARLGGLAAACAALIGEGLVDFTFRNIVVAELAWAVLALALAGTTIVRQSSLTPRP